MLRQLRLIPILLQMNLRAQMEYRGAFLIDRLAMIITYASSLAVIWLLVARFDTLADWNWGELALLYSFHTLGYAIGASFSFTQMRDLEEQVRLGTFDALLTRPMSPWVYLVFARFNIGYVSHISLALVVMTWALLTIPIDWSIGWVAYFLASLLSAALVTGSIMTLLGAAALAWTRSNHLYSLYFGFWELSRYPLNLFPSVIQGILLTVVPLGFMAAVPVAVLVGKPVPLLGELAPIAALLAGPALLGLTALFWRYATSRYQGAGG